MHTEIQTCSKFTYNQDKRVLCNICPKLTIMTLERRQVKSSWYQSCLSWQSKNNKSVFPGTCFDLYLIFLLVFVAQSNTRNTRTIGGIFSNLTIKGTRTTSLVMSRPGFFFVKFQQISNIALVFLILTLNK